METLNNNSTANKKKVIHKTTSIDLENNYEKFKHNVHRLMNGWPYIIFFTILTIWVLF